MKLASFRKGVHPRDHKHQTANRPIETLPLPSEVFIPLQQHIGTPCRPLVARRDKVLTGQVIGEPTGHVSSPVHATISGTIKSIDFFPHPLGAPCQMIHITSDNKDEWYPQEQDESKWETLDVSEIIARIKAAGVVGMGGAAFPSHVKLTPPTNKPIDVLVINGCECEPYLSADHRIMVEQADQVVLGVRILMKALGAQRAIIGIEVNKLDAIAALQAATVENTAITVAPLKVKYPQGAEKFLIKATLGREVPSEGLPLDVGVVVNNVATAVAIADAVTRNRPLIERVLTVAGDGITEPKNVRARIGTPLQHIADFCGGIKDNTTQVLMGGPMMGVAQFSLAVPVIKGTSGLLCFTQSSALKNIEHPCIKCGRCVNVCPLNLLPTKLAALVKQNKLEEASDLGIMNCADCGSCAYVCPAHIPLVQWLRIGKLQVNAERKKQSSGK